MVLTKIGTYNGSVHGTYVFCGVVHSFTSSLCGDLLYISVFCNKEVISYGFKFNDPTIPDHIAKLGRRILMEMFPDKSKFNGYVRQNIK